MVFWVITVQVMVKRVLKKWWNSGGESFSGDAYKSTVRGEPCSNFSLRVNCVCPMQVKLGWRCVIKHPHRTKEWVERKTSSCTATSTARPDDMLRILQRWTSNLQTNVSAPWPPPKSMDYLWEETTVYTTQADVPGELTLLKLKVQFLILYFTIHSFCIRL